jgi:thioredoxin reductase (NADPH)
MIGASTLDEYRKHIENDAVTIPVCVEVHEVQGDGALETIVTQDLRTGERGHLDTRAVFVFIGAVPNTAWLTGAVALPDHGFVPTGPAANPDTPAGRLRPR